MRQRLIVFIILTACVTLATEIARRQGSVGISPTLVLGFLLLAAYCIAFFLEKIRLPRITGFIIAGLILGPHVLNLFDAESVNQLGFINTLALAFIAFSAGAELKLDSIRRNLRHILLLSSGVTIGIFTGVTGTVFLLSGWIPFMSGSPAIIRLVVSTVFGTIAVSCSPASTIAVISETKAKGDYTDTVLSVTIITDVLIIILFGIVISVSQAIISNSGLHFFFLLGLLIEIGISFLLGLFLGKTALFLIRNVGVAFPIILTGIGFLVIKFSYLIAAQLQQGLNIGLNLEPLLICMAAGFTVQNFSKHGTLFLIKMDRISAPIYIAFFALTGASINLDVMKTGWLLGIVIVISRIATLFIGSYTSGRLSGDRPLNYRYTWLGFITQAGVSLGLLSEVVRRFPEIGVPVQTILITAITLNQLIGPVALKYALEKTGETRNVQPES